MESPEKRQNAIILKPDAADKAASGCFVLIEGEAEMVSPDNMNAMFIYPFRQKPVSPRLFGLSIQETPPCRGHLWVKS